MGARATWRTCALGALALVAPPVPAQDDRPGFVGRQIENALSGPGREVRVRGFAGALSGRATMDEMTFADAEGVWLTLTDAVLDWNRAALLRGRLSVRDLTAAEIVLARPPLPAPPERGLPAPPPAAARGFALPELPVAVTIGAIDAARIRLGAPVLGEAAEFRLTGSLSLEGGTGAVDLDLVRLDGPADLIGLAAGFDNATRVLALDLTLREEPGGLVGNLANLPGAPSLALDVDGTGPLEDYTARIDLATDGAPRLAGSVTLRGVGADGAEGLRFAADLGGDITPVLAPDLRGFFGPDIRLVADGLRGADGALALERFDLATRSLTLAGTAALDAGGVPRAFDVTGRLADPDGAPVRLPAGTEITLDGATLAASFDAAVSPDWTLDLAAQDLATEAARVETLRLSGGGTISAGGGSGGGSGAGEGVTAVLDYAAEGLALADAALAQALGARVGGRADLAWGSGAPLAIRALTLGGADYGLQAAGTVAVAERQVEVEGRAALRADDLARFSGLAGRDLAGRAAVALAGSATPIAGAFDLTLDLAGDDLSAGEATLDRFLEGPVRLALAARRDGSGTRLDRLSLDSAAVTAQVSGRAVPGASALDLSARLADAGLLRPDLAGAISVAGTAREAEADLWDVDLDIAAPHEAALRLAGRAGVAPATAPRTDVTLSLAVPDLAPLVPGQSGAVSVEGTARGTADALYDVALDVAGPQGLTATVAGAVGLGADLARSDVTFDARLPDLAAFVPRVPGPVRLTGSAAGAEGGSLRVGLDATAPEGVTARVDGTLLAGWGDLRLALAVPEVAAFAPGIPGAVALRGTATERDDGLWDVALEGGLPFGATARVTGAAGAADSDLAFAARLPDLGALSPALTGALDARGSARQLPARAWEVAADLAGPDRATAALRALLAADRDAGGTEATARLDVPRLAALAPALPGALRADISAAARPGGTWALDVDATGPYAATLAASGTLGGGATDATATLRLPDLAPLAPGIAGGLALDASARQAPGAPVDVTLDARLPYAATARVTGQVAPGATALRLAADLPSITPLVPALEGGLRLEGTAQEGPAGWAVDLASTGPGAGPTVAAARARGTLAPDFATADLALTGSAPLALANALIAPTRLEGRLDLDLALRGAPALEALSGTLATSGARVEIAAIGQALEAIDLTATLAGAQATLAGSARAPGGGGLTVAGPISLAPPLPADLAITLDALALEDPGLYSTTLGGEVTVSGPLAGGATIAGRIDVGRTELRIPDGGGGFGGQLPPIEHAGESASVRQTRERAGLVREAQRLAAAQADPRSGGFGLDLTILAPNQVFLRGRGLDAELGGGFRVGGTTRAPAPVGGIEVVRGRLDVLGRRLELERDGRVTLGGDLRPFLDLVATSATRDLTVLIGITGPIDNPAFRFTSAPPLPEDEVLAQFFFGKGLASLSAFEAAQLAASVAQLTGRGGGGLLGGLREGLGVDDLNLVTDDDGNAGLQVGQYLTDNIYTDVTTSTSGMTELNINIDLSDSVTVRGSADNAGESALGLFFQRDY